MKELKGNDKKYTLTYTLRLLNKMRKPYTISFYTGGVNLDDWQNLKQEEKKQALSRSWYIRWSFRNHLTGKLERQKNIKAGVNRLKTMSKRHQFLKDHKEALSQLLDSGYNPFLKETEKFINFQETENIYTVKKAFELSLDHVKLTVSDLTFKDYFYAKEHFLKFIGVNNHNENIKNINKSVVISFLNDKLKTTSARTRNNYKSSLSALFSVMEQKLNIIERNFIREITNEKTKPKTDRTFTKKQLSKIVNWLKINDPYLLLYIKFVAYNFLRPVEVNRLKVKDINLDERLLYFKAKNKPLKIKRIPSIFLEDLKNLNLHTYNKEFYLFTPKNIPDNWESSDNSRRDNFSKRFKKVKNVFKLGLEYGLYSFRHSFITNLFRYLRTSENKTYSQAIEILQPITGHETKEALEKYIHNIDADIPEDWSDKIDFIL